MFCRIVCCYLTVFFAAAVVAAPAVFSPQPKNSFIIDDFEDANLLQFPKWWAFDAMDVSTEPNVQTEFKGLGKRSLQLTGKQEEWYVGGVGTFFAIDARRFNALKLLVRGYGPKSAVLIVELFDDDNGNYIIEPHPKILSETLADDKFIHTVKVDWVGWRVVIIPFTKFVDVNQGIGDDLWNPYQVNKSGGLLQMQLVLLCSDKDVQPRVRIDAARFYYQGKMPIKKRQRTESYRSADDSFFFN